MIRTSIRAQITAATLLLGLLGQPALAAERGMTKTPGRLGPIQRAIQSQDWTAGTARGQAFSQRLPLRQAHPPRQASRKLVCGIIGFVAGTVAGGLLGSQLSADDPDGGGVLLGASVGALAGPVLGVWIGSR